MEFEFGLVLIFFSLILSYFIFRDSKLFLINKIDSQKSPELRKNVVTVIPSVIVLIIVHKNFYNYKLLNIYVLISMFTTLV